MRKLDDWLDAFSKYTSNTESPVLMHSWAGVSAIAGCLRRKVWLDMKAFQWTPSFYIIFVAPPGIVAKSTTADLSIDLLRKVPGIKFGPDIVTWPALVDAFSAAGESFLWNEEWHPMSAITLIASELGNLINPQDREQINLYITLWDGRRTLEKVTKMSGNNMVEAPWINMVGCTTPHWIADNMPVATVGGGFTSRCIFVYADKKERLIAYPDEVSMDGYEEMRADLIHDLEHISTALVGPYSLSGEARVWGRNWYERHWDERPVHLESDKLDGYIARKQTHLHKLAMVLSASQRDDLVIDIEDLVIAETMLNQTEQDLDKVFARVGSTPEGEEVRRFLEVMKRKGTVAYLDAYRIIYSAFPNARDYEGILQGAINAGYVKLIQLPSGPALTYIDKELEK